MEARSLRLDPAPIGSLAVRSLAPRYGGIEPADSSTTTAGSQLVYASQRQDKVALVVVDLEITADAPAPLVLLHATKWGVTDLDWNPHPSHRQYIVTASGQRALVWNVDAALKPVESVLNGHTRSISDLSWSLFDPNVLATCSVDSYTHIWDIRTPKKPASSVSGWTTGASQVKWNRYADHILASAYGNELRIWDLRKGSMPIVVIPAHLSRINGIDWSHAEEHQILTCSEDRKVKIWDTITSTMKQDIETASPVWRARYTPFGNGVVTMPQRKEKQLYVWSLEDSARPIHYFTHSDTVKDFVWRIGYRSGEPVYQLVSITQDNRLNLWPLEKHIFKACGYTPKDVVTDDADTKSRSSSVSGTSSSKMATKIDSKLPLHDSAPQNLTQEFSLVNTQISNVIVEQMSSALRSCVVSATSPKYDALVRLRVAFPAMYPNNAPPSFEFLPASTVSNSIKRKLNESLTELAMLHVANHRPCLEICLRHLVTSMDAFLSEESTIEEDDDQDMMTNPKNDRIIPFPRLAGGVFCGNNTLVCFWSASAMQRHYSEGIPRNLEEYRQHATSRQEFQHQFSTSTRGSDFPMNASGMLISDSPSLSSVNSNSSEAFLSRAASEEMSTLSRKPTQFVSTMVAVQDVSALLPFSRTLARSYRIFGEDEDDRLAVCLRNAELAAKTGRKDLVRIWAIAATVMKSFHEKSELRPMWPHHPFGRKAVDSLFQYCKQVGDVQTLAHLICVFTDLLDIYPVPHKREMDLIRASANGKPTTFDWTMDIEQRTSNFGYKNIYEDTTELHRKESYDAYLNMYADMLFNWGLLVARSEILKCSRGVDSAASTPFPLRGGPPADQYSGFEIQCRNCKKNDRNPRCTGCKRFAFHCAVCQIAVKGSSVACLACGHGGHWSHMEHWFRASEVCPTGCGCECRPSLGRLLLQSSS